jgi:hypothetical protein
MRVSEKSLPLLAEYARSGRVVVFDTETTGGRSYDEICQIAAVEYVNGTMARTLALYVCPTCEMNPWAEAVHGLSLDFLAEHGMSPEDAMRQRVAGLHALRREAEIELPALLPHHPQIELGVVCDKQRIVADELEELAHRIFRREAMLMQEVERKAVHHFRPWVHLARRADI